MVLPIAHRDYGQGMRYQRIMQLGSGGMAIVYLALAVGQSGFKRLVVVKAIREELVANSDMHQMFLAEARLSARLNHPNVVQVSEVVDAEEGVMLVMEYLEGLSFAASYRTVGDALTLPMRIRVLCEVLAGLGYAHDLADYHGKPLGIVHRDVSPQNIFITYDGRVKLLDFGIAKATAGPDVTRAGVIKGRIAYMPGEQLKGERVDRRTDIYAVGCLLWEAIAGTRMWEKLGEPQIACRVLEGKIPKLSSRVQVDPELERIVDRATAHVPAQRYPTAEAMRLDLERYLSSGSLVTLREIGALLSAAAGDAREQRQALIAQSIARVERDFPSLNDDAPADSVAAWSTGSTPASVPRSENPLGPMRHSSGTRPRVTMAESIEMGFPAALTPSQPTVVSRRRSRATWLVLGGLLLAATSGALLHTRTVVDEPRRSAQPANAVPELEPFLRVDVTPEGAQVLIDGRRIDGKAATLRVSRNTEHTIRVERAGYVPVERRVFVDVDTSLRVDLEAESAAEPNSLNSERSRARRRLPFVAGRPAPASSAEAKKEGGCDPPYFFAGGIKTYKPECI